MLVSAAISASAPPAGVGEEHEPASTFGSESPTPASVRAMTGCRPLAWRNGLRCSLSVAWMVLLSELGTVEFSALGMDAFDAKNSVQRLKEWHRCENCLMLIID